METLTVWTFDAPPLAGEALPRCVALARAGRIAVDDAALVVWEDGRRKPSLTHLGALTGPGALWAGFWGVLLGLIFLVPLAGPAFGAAAGAFASSLADLGVEDDFVKRVRDAVTPGTSALFVISGTAAASALARELAVAPLLCDLAEEAVWIESRRPREVAHAHR